jgi:hypothetical protein
MTNQAGRGIVDAGNRVLEQVLAKTCFKDDLRALLMNIDPENAPKFVRTLLGKDVEVPLAIVSALPGLANTLILMADELAAQMNEKFPPPLLQGFAASLLNEIDQQALSRAVSGITQLVRTLMPVIQETRMIFEKQQAGAGKEAPGE